MANNSDKKIFMKLIPTKAIAFACNTPRWKNGLSLSTLCSDAKAWRADDSHYFHAELPNHKQKLAQEIRGAINLR